MTPRKDGDFKTFKQKNMNTETSLQIQTTQEIIANIPDTLIRNQTAVEKITAKTNQLLSRVAEGMDDEVDAVLNDEIIKFKAAGEACKNRRSPAFQAVDEFRKKFTAIEKQIEDSANLLQSERNKWATIKAEEAKKIEVERQRKLAKDQEAITIKNDLNVLLQQHVNAYMAEAKRFWNTIFETITLDTQEKDKANLASVATPYRQDHFNSFLPKVHSVHHSSEEIQEIISNCKIGKYDLFNKQVISEITSFKAELFDKIPSKIKEIEAKEAARIAKEKADKEAAEASTAAQVKAAAAAQEKAKAEQERLAADEAKRKADEEIRLKAEKEKADQEAQRKAEADKQIEQTQSLFDSQVEAAGNQAPDVKESYEIKLKSSAGYMPIIAYYFEKEGLKELPEKIEKKTLKQMVAFAEKAALKDEKEKIVSPYIEYVPTYAAKKIKS